MNPPKCYAWLESYGSPLSDRKKKKYFLNPISRQNFANAFVETPNLNLEVCHTCLSSFLNEWRGHMATTWLLHICIVHFQRACTTIAVQLKYFLIFSQNCPTYKFLCCFHLLLFPPPGKDQIWLGIKNSLISCCPTVSSKFSGKLSDSLKYCIKLWPRALLDNSMNCNSEFKLVGVWAHCYIYREATGEHI